MNICFTAQYIPIILEKKIGTMFLWLSKPFFQTNGAEQRENGKYILCFLCATCVNFYNLLVEYVLVHGVFWQSFLFEKCSSVLEGEDYLQLWKFCWNFLTLLQELQGGSFTFMISPTSLLWKKRCSTFIISKLKLISKLHLQFISDYFITPMKKLHGHIS